MFLGDMPTGNHGISAIAHRCRIQH